MFSTVKDATQYNFLMKNMPNCITGVKISEVSDRTVFLLLTVFL